MKVNKSREKVKGENSEKNRERNNKRKYIIKVERKWKKNSERK